MTENRDDRLFELLDELAGNPPDLAMPDPDAVDPVPLSEGLADRAVARLRERQAARPGATEHTRARPRVWWRRAAAVWPLTSLLLVASTVVVFTYWSGRNSETELTYEDAFDAVVDDRTFNIEGRNSAMGRIEYGIRQGIRATRAFERTPSVQRRANSVIEELRRLVRSPPRTPNSALPVGTMKSAIVRLADPSMDPTTQLFALDSFLESARRGLTLIHSARSRNDLLGKEAPRLLANIERSLQ